MLFRMRGPHFIDGGYYDAPSTAGPPGSGADVDYDLPPTFQMEGADQEGVDAVNQLWQGYQGTDAPWTLEKPSTDPYAPATPTPAPVNVDVPALLVNDAVASSAAVGDTLTCTTGNWQNEPTSYDFQWRRDGVDFGGGGSTDTYVPVAADAGHAISCLVTAVNAAGVIEAPPSNEVTVTGAASRSAPKEKK